MVGWEVNGQVHSLPREVLGELAGGLREVNEQAHCI